MSTDEAPARKRSGGGFLNPTLVVDMSFWTIALCILIAVVASILAIWNFTGTDVLWRTVATCAVIAGGTGLFAVVNQVFGHDR